MASWSIIAEDIIAINENRKHLGAVPRIELGEELSKVQIEEEHLFNLKSGGEIQKLIEEYEEKKTIPSYQAVMEVIVQANRKEMEVEKRMCNALRELFEDEFKEAETNGKKEGKKRRN